MNYYVTERYYNTGKCEAVVETSATELPASESNGKCDIYRESFKTLEQANRAVAKARKAMVAA
jgi:hypothetical protein